jgi:hypothetical protein
MGIIAGALSPYPPIVIWSRYGGATDDTLLIVFIHAAIGLGTLSGGWRIVRTMGHELHACSPSAALPRKRRARSRFCRAFRHPGLALLTQLPVQSCGLRADFARALNVADVSSGPDPYDTRFRSSDVFGL